MFIPKSAFSCNSAVLPACANVWVVFINVLFDFFFVAEFESRIPDNTENVPGVSSKVSDHTS